MGGEDARGLSPYDLRGRVLSKGKAKVYKGAKHSSRCAFPQQHDNLLPAPLPSTHA